MFNMCSYRLTTIDTLLTIACVLQQAVCTQWLETAFKEQGQIDIYDIYADVCVQPPEPSATANGVGSSSSSNSNSQGAGKAGSSKKYMGALLGDVGTRLMASAGKGIVIMACCYVVVSMCRG